MKKIVVEYKELCTAIQYVKEAKLDIYQDFVECCIEDYLDPQVSVVEDTLVISQIDHADMLALPTWWLIKRQSGLIVVDDRTFKAFYEYVG